MLIIYSLKEFHVRASDFISLPEDEEKVPLEADFNINPCTRASLFSIASEKL